MLLEEYRTLESMSRSLASHRKGVDAVARRIARKMAGKELDRALKELKLI